MEHGFFHPSIGYWQTFNYPDEKYRKEYPEGYVKVPLKPSQHYEWTGTEWVEVLPPEFNPATHKIEKVTEQDDGVFSYRYDVLELPLEVAEANIRMKRGGLLAQSDWIVPYHLERGQAVPQEWLDYRQALRDITTQEGFPYNVVWPTKPE